jgi:hypothetical protein
MGRDVQRVAGVVVQPGDDLHVGAGSPETLSAADLRPILDDNDEVIPEQMDFDATADY